MATSSIFNNIVLNTEAEAQALVSAYERREREERSAQVAERASTAETIPCVDAVLKRIRASR